MDDRTGAKLLADALQMATQLRAWNRHVHAHPELSGQEEFTARYVADELRQLGYRPAERMGGGYGVTADLDGPAGPLVALRADMDALPVPEETGRGSPRQTPE
ncbi:MAG: hypothetical protein KKB50_14200 [Planctomycetes bacterium]|nr:hypothetical protein [Planctomycetota bacterium]